MKKYISAALAAVAAIAVSNTAFAQCFIYSGTNFEGQSGIIQPNDFVKFYEGDVGEFPHSDVKADARVFTDVSWLNNIGSAKVTNGCNLITFDKASGKVKHSRFVKDSPILEANMTNEVPTEMASAYCSCP